jgi:hypothetical protein
MPGASRLPGELKGSSRRALLACKADGMPLGSLGRELLLQMHRARANLHENGRAAHEWKLLPGACADGASLGPPAYSGNNGRDPVAHGDGNDSSTAGQVCTCTMVQKADSIGGVLAMFSPQIRAMLRQRCSRPGDYFHRRSWNGQEGARRADWVSIIFSASPVTLAYNKWQFQAVLFAIASVQAFLILRPDGLLDQFLAENRVTGRHFRFEATELRAGKGVPASEVAIGALSLTDNGCKVLALESSVAQQGAVLHLSGQNGKAISANGFAFHTSSAPSDVDRDPVGFDFSFCSDLSAATPADCPSEKWHVVGSAECLFTWVALQCFPVKAGKFATSLERGVEHVFDLRAPPWHSLAVMNRLIWEMMGMLVSCMISFTNYFHTARVVGSVVAFFLNGLVNGVLMAIINFLNFYGTHQAFAGIYAMTGGLAMMGWAVCLVFYEHRVFSGANGLPSYLEFVLICFAFILPLDGILTHGGGQSADWWLFSMSQLGHSEVVLMLTFYIFIKTFKSLVWHQALKSVQPDMDAYNQEWEDMAAESGTQESLDKLAELTRKFEKRAGQTQVVVQRLVEAPITVSLTPFCTGVPAVHSRKKEVACLDQLYLQAHLVWPVCVKLVHAWAQSSGGFLMVEKTSTLQATSIALSHVHSPSRRNSLAKTGAAGDEADGDLGDDVVIGTRRWDGFLSLVSVEPENGWGGLCSWNHVKIGGQRARVKWAGIKKPTRAIEKVQRVYNKDVSRLIDLVRQSIVFHSLGELATCLDTILRDPQVALSRACSPPRCLVGLCEGAIRRVPRELLMIVVAMPTVRDGAGQVMVLRVKNRYSKDSKATTTGGYRGE